MKPRAPKSMPKLGPRFVANVRARLAENKRVRRSLPEWGRIHIDRQLPFLCVYRRPPDRADLGTERFATSGASYLIASGTTRQRAGLHDLLGGISNTLVETFGACLLLELWTGTPVEQEHPGDREARRPGFRIHAPRDPGLDELIERFRDILAKISLGGLAAQVEIQRGSRIRPPGLSPPMSPAEIKDVGVTLLGLEIRPVFRDPEDGQVYPLIIRQLRRSLSRGLLRMFHEFSCERTTHCPTHYHMLGRRAMVKAVWEVDRQLADVADRFDFLLQVTPVNLQVAWREFKRRRYERPPRFLYRPIEEDPALLKRKLFATPVERVEDPTLLMLFRQKQLELDRQLSMLYDRNTKRFRLGSALLYGPLDPALLDLASDLLSRIPPRSRESSREGHLDAASFVRLAEEEIAEYRREWPELEARVELRNDITGGLLVSRGNLFVSESTRIPRSRARALLQHEVGTHIVTYFNGRAQPFRQLYTGLSGYEALQEGLAVLAEFLAGGLSRPRLRLLAGRVIAVHHMLSGADFIETFHALNRDAGFETATAFSIAARVHRGGGLSKDMIYLRGLVEVLEYLSRGGDLKPLFVGKIAADHIPIIQELRWRGVLRDSPLTPRYLEYPETERRLEYLKRGVKVPDLVGRKAP